MITTTSPIPGPGGLPSPGPNWTFHEDFIRRFDTASYAAAGTMISADNSSWWAVGVFSFTAIASGAYRLVADGTNIPALSQAYASASARSLFIAKAKNATIKFRAQLVGTAGALVQRHGVSDAVNAGFASDQNGVYIRYTENAGNFVAVARQGGTETTLTCGAVDTTAHDWRFVFSAGGTSLEVFKDNVSQGTITTNLPTGLMGFAFGRSAATGSGGFEIEYAEVTQDR